MPRKIRRLDFGEEVALVDHLDELRNRLFVALASLGVAFCIAFWRHGDILRLLNRQLPQNGHHNQFQPITLGIGEPFMLAVTVSLYAAVIIALPVLFYQLYAFVIPAFSAEASKRIWPILLFVPALFVAGVAFCYIVVLPAAVSFLLGFDHTHYNVQVRAKDYYSFALMLMGAMGLIFEMPAAIMALARVGIVNARMLRRNRRYAVVILAAGAAALPGVDPVSMMAEFIPLLLLYELSIVLARVMEGRRAVGESEPDEDDQLVAPVTYR